MSYPLLRLYLWIGVGASEQAAAVGAGAGTLLAAPIPDAAVPDANPYYGLPYDDDLDAVYPVSLPEDPFPEALFADRPCDGDLIDDGPLDDGVHHRGTTPGWLLPAADLTADSAGLIDQVRGYENVKCWAAGQQARLSVAFEARLRQEPTDRPPLAAETWATTAAQTGTWARPNR
jgi:hypothetical protein